jgi:hypothetical protein
MWTFIAGFFLGGITLFIVTIRIMVGINKKAISDHEPTRFSDLQFVINLLRREVFNRVLSEFGGEKFIFNMEESASNEALAILEADMTEFREFENEFDFESLKKSELDIYGNKDMVDFSLDNTGLSGEDLAGRYIWLSRLSAFTARKAYDTSSERVKVKARVKKIESIFEAKRQSLLV